MYAVALKFPNSFLKNTVFIFYGETPSSVFRKFIEIQDIECHVLNIREYIDMNKREDDYNFTEEIYNRSMGDIDISSNELKRFFDLCPEVCFLIEYCIGDNVVEDFKIKYPNSLIT